MHVSEEPLDIRLPNNQLGMVIMQPLVELSATEPFRWLEEKRELQINRVLRTLEIANGLAHGEEKTHFTVFPEYAIPGLEGVDRIQRVLSANTWSRETVVIGGVDGLSKGEYTSLCEQADTRVHPLNQGDHVGERQWVNCCVIWAKQQDGTLIKWIQPKLVPSWDEMRISHRHMFSGQAITVFGSRFDNDVPCNFTCLICFDWIGRIGNEFGVFSVLSTMNNLWKSSGVKELSFIFLIQHNNDPNHRNFLENARNFFEKVDHSPSVNRKDGSIVFANTAGGDRPGKHQTHGFSGLIFSPQVAYDVIGSCPPTYSTDAKKLRRNDSLGRCKEALLREAGSCHHSLSCRTARFVNPGSPDRALPIGRAVVHAIDDGITDPRVPGDVVPASVKWINDELDFVTPFLRGEHGNPLKDQIGLSHHAICEELRIQPSDTLSSYLINATENMRHTNDKWLGSDTNKGPNIDNWNGEEVKALECIIHSLSIIKTCNTLSIQPGQAHGVITKESQIIDVIVVSGKEHVECLKYMKERFPGRSPKFTLLISRDEHDTPWPRRYGPVTDVREPDTAGGPRIYDPSPIHRGLQDLKDCAVNSRNDTELGSKIATLFGI